MFLTQDNAGRLQVALGEAKGGTSIDERDVDSLRRLAMAMSDKNLDVYRVFAKAAEFTPRECELCLDEHEDSSPHVVMFSRCELEPYELWEINDASGLQKHYEHSLSGLAQRSRLIYSKSP